MQTILGAGGAIGTALAKELAGFTDSIRLMSRTPKKINHSDELIAGDLADGNLVRKAVEGSEVVYLTAGLPYKTKVWQQQWPLVINNVINACAATGTRLVFFDNVYMYDPAGLLNMTEETTVKPASKKGSVRAQLHKAIFDAVQEQKIEAMVVRSADFYGPGVNNSVLMETVFKNFKKGKRAMWMGKPDAIHSMTYVPDAARATALLGNTDDAYNQVWHLPTDHQPVKGEDWVKLFAAGLGVEPKFSAISTGMVKFLGIFNPFMRELGEMMYQFDRDYFFNSKKFEGQFPDFRITTPQEGVQEVIALDIFGGTQI